MIKQDYDIMSEKLEKQLLELCEKTDREYLKNVPPENPEERLPHMKKFEKYLHLLVLGV